MFNPTKVDNGPDSSGREWGNPVRYGNYGACGYRYFLVKRADLNAIARSGRIKGFWMDEKAGGAERHYLPNRAKIFVTCPGCGAVNNISDHTVDPDGEIGLTDCVVCCRCRVHFFPKLLGWKEFLKE